MFFFKKREPIIDIPADVPQPALEEYKENYLALTRGKDRLLLFAADQKIEHLNTDFHGESIPPESNNPQNLFNIAQKGDVGALATHLGMIAQYGPSYKSINYIAKLNGKTNLVSTQDKDPVNAQLWTVEDALKLKKERNINIRGVGFTLYLGSEFETTMLAQAAKVIHRAHHHGLVAILWMYPRGKSIENERDGNLIAGAAGVACALGADFAKINPPEATETATSAEWLAIASQAAGKTKLICSGGSKMNAEQFLETLYTQIHTGKTAGAAIGRNIFQKPFAQAIAFTKATSAVVYDDKTVQRAKRLLK